MTTIRGRLTIWYTVAMAVVLLAFGTALVIERRHPSFDELDQRLSAAADFVTGWLTQAHGVVGALTTADSGGLAGPSHRILASNIASYLEGVRDPLVVVDSSRNLLWASDEARQLGYTSIERLLVLLQPTPSARATGSVSLAPGQGDYRYMVVPVTAAGPGIAAILVATRTRTLTVRAPAAGPLDARDRPDRPARCPSGSATGWPAGHCGRSTS